MSGADPTIVRAWLDLLHGQAPGHTHICSTGDWTGQVYSHLDAATRYACWLDRQGREGIYVRVTTLRAALPPGRRGGAADTLALPALWADIDIAGPGHQHDPTRHGGKDLPPDEAAARAIIATSGLPEPSGWVGSGGGFYPIWLLDTPWVLDTPEHMAIAEQLCAGWQQVIAAAAGQLGWHYGAGVGDLARVLRIPGTVNRKAGLARLCHVVSATDIRYTRRELVQACQIALADVRARTQPTAPTEAHPSAGGPQGGPGDRPGDTWAGRTDWVDILAPHGWTLHYQRDQIRYWTRPGKTTGISASTNALGTDRLHVFTTSTAFDADNSYSKFGAYALLEHGGDHKAAAAALAREGHGDSTRPTVGPDGGGQQAQLLAGILGPGQLSDEMPPGIPADPVEGGGPPSRWFSDSGGLLVATFAAAVLEQGPLAVGADDICWAYQHGVWAPARHIVRDRAVALLGDRYARRHIASIEDVVRSQVPTISCDPIPDLINFRNGLLHWATGELQEHTPEIRTTVQLAVDWTPDATCPHFERFIGEVVPDDMVPVVWELIGYLMMSGNPLHKAVMLMGTGRNGKGTLLRAVVALLGKENITSISLHDLVTTRFATVSLFGRLANIAGDIDATYIESTAIFKAITGQDQISAEHKFGHRFDFTPWAVPVFSANEIPPSADTSLGYLARWLPIPFPHSFAGKEDRTLDAKLAAETTGIATKATGALRRLMERGEFERPPGARAALDEFARRVDQVRSWLADCCEPIPPQPHDPATHPFIARATIYETYRRWCARDGHRALQANKLYDRLGGAGATPVTIRGARGFRGITITDRVDPPPAPPLGNWWTTDGDDRVDRGADPGAGGVQVLCTPQTPPEQPKQAEGAEGAAFSQTSRVRGGAHAHTYTRETKWEAAAPPAPPLHPGQTCIVCGQPLDPALATQWHQRRVHPSCHTEPTP